MNGKNGLINSGKKKVVSLEPKSKKESVKKQLCLLWKINDKLSDIELNLNEVSKYINSI
jgi:hypothetical protein